jgi:hypothetical protein
VTNLKLEDILYAFEFLLVSVIGSRISHCRVNCIVPVDSLARPPLNLAWRELYLAVNSSKLSSLCASLRFLTLVLKVLHPPSATAAVVVVDDTSGKRRRVCEGRKKGVEEERKATRNNADDDIPGDGKDSNSRVLLDERGGTALSAMRVANRYVLHLLVVRKLWSR